LVLHELLGEGVLEVPTLLAVVALSMDPRHSGSHRLLLSWGRVLNPGVLGLLVAGTADALDVNLAKVVLAWAPLRLDPIGVNSLRRDEGVVRIRMVDPLMDVAHLVQVVVGLPAIRVDLGPEGDVLLDDRHELHLASLVAWAENQTVLELWDLPLRERV
jgi:hypothetical protein